MNGVNCITVN